MVAFFEPESVFISSDLNSIIQDFYVVKLNPSAENISGVSQ